MGVNRKMDELGRIVLPIDHRRIMGWEKDDTLRISADVKTRTIILSKDAEGDGENRAVPCKRKMDELGRVVIPEEFRNEMGLGQSSECAVTCNHETKEVHLLFQPDCSFCHSTKSLIMLRDKLICESCKAELLADAVSA